LQIAIGIVDLSCCAFAMWVLMPDDPHIGFVMLAVIFVSATLLGFASHAPGGIGVFDGAMLIALWQFDREDVLAGLLLFRLVYYIIPFALALLILGIREVLLNCYLSRKPADSPRTMRPSSRPAPRDCSRSSSSHHSSAAPRTARAKSPSLSSTGNASAIGPA
jgi:hypothetical protein